ncbi:myb-like protein X [Oppia nitens]|uniref:myb-like protein X n=1 Tax=Oppia nitens TaxID=1686743 RepID=UPI0023DADBCA|nr:myb-like protein X [Oppia nitens]
MSSDEEFESADEEFDCDISKTNVRKGDPQLTPIDKPMIDKIPQISEINHNINENLEDLQDLCQQSVTSSAKSQENKLSDGLEKCKTNDSLLISEATKSDLKSETIESKDKVVIKGRKVNRKTNISIQKTKVEEITLNDQTLSDSSIEEIGDQSNDSISKIDIKEDKTEGWDINEDILEVVETEETQQIIEENNDFITNVKTIESDVREIEKNENEETTELLTSETIKSEVKEKYIKDENEKTIEENEYRDKTNIIKGRKLLRKAERLQTDQTNDNESEISEDKKAEVLNKLSDLKVTNKWDNWFSDIKSAAKTATSTTVSHVSKASNSWSFDSNSLLSSAASITSQVGSGLTSIVDNVTSVVDTAIGAPTPEQLAAMVENEAKGENKCNQLDISSKPQHKPANENSNQGFGLFGFSFGQKVSDIVPEDSNKYDKRKSKND